MTPRTVHGPPGALGVHRLLELLGTFRFGPTEIAYLRTLGFGEQTLSWLRAFEPSGEVWAVPDEDAPARQPEHAGHYPYVTVLLSVMDTFPSPTALHDRFRGALLGTAVGDALGAPFEGSPTVNATDLAAWVHADAALRWTDDTHMSIGVAESLIACGGFDGQHMAGRFVANHDAEPWRGYGAGPPIVFDGLRRGAAWDEPAAALFDGQGSYGDGAAMRAAPAGLFAVHDVADAAHLARQTARITHAHELAQDGAALQSSAVAWLATVAPTPHWLTALGLMQELRLVARTDVFQDKLAAVERLAGNAPVHDAAALLGTGIAAAEAVPAALFAFTRHIDSFTDAVACAVQLGGDTDTIAAMTGALAGAFHGATAIPTPWRNRLEASDRLESLADELFTVAARQRADAEAP